MVRRAQFKTASIFSATVERFFLVRRLDSSIFHASGFSVTAEDDSHSQKGVAANLRKDIPAMARLPKQRMT